jgi:hypothetical protein
VPQDLQTLSGGDVAEAFSAELRRPLPRATCAEESARLGVDTAGTASAIRSWLLLETPGPWGEGVRDDAFAAALGEDGWRSLQRLWEDQQLRPLVVRRPGRAGRTPTEEPVLLLGAAGSAGRWLERLPARALPDVDLEALAAGRPGHGEPVEGPLLAVCTNGSVDRCCALRGRPLVAALAQAHPDRTWEVSHVGGCSFAANLLVLPDAVLHGRLTPEDGLRIAAAAVDGRLDARQLRGPCGSSRFAGVADVALRRRLELAGRDDVQLLSEHAHADLLDLGDGPEPAGADVLLRAAGATWRAVTRTQQRGPASSVCDGTSVASATVLISLDLA